MDYLRYSRNAFVRHCENSTFIINQRNEFSVLLENAEPFLRHITYFPQPLDEIIAMVAYDLKCQEHEISKDFQHIIKVLSNGALIVSSDTHDKNNDDFQYYTRSEIKKKQWGVINTHTEDDISCDEVIHKFTERHQAPYALHIDLTDSCNLKCSHCYIPKRSSPQYLSLESIKKIMDEFRDMSGVMVVLSGGEPMLHPKFIDVVRYANNKNLMTIILSNLTQINENIASALREANIFYLQTSLFSLTPCIHDAITGCHDSFRRTMNGIELIRKYNIPLRINTTVLKENYDTWSDVRKFCEEQNYKFTSNPYVMMRCDHNDVNTKCEMSDKQLTEYLSANNRTHLKMPSYQQLSAPVCSIMRHNLNIDSYGNFYPCDGCHQLILGNINRNSLKDIWQGDEANALRNLRLSDYPECAACKNLDFCKLCPTNNFNETGDVLHHSSRRCKIAQLKHKLAVE